MNIDRRYITEVLGGRSTLNVDMVKKDLVLSYLLQGLSELEELVFKGGTCLSKCYLSYHRLSEDLDFNLELDAFSSKTQFKKGVRDYLKTVFLPKLQAISAMYNLDFDADEFSSVGTRYCPVKNGDNIFIFYVYLNSRDANPIKIELNISEQRFFDTKVRDVIHLNADSTFLVYPLRKHEITCYTLDEIILEKIRAILTRVDGISERDIFDLFLIHDLQDVFAIDKMHVADKVRRSFLFNLDSVMVRFDLLNQYVLFEEIDSLVIITYDKEVYKAFFTAFLLFCAELKTVFDGSTPK